MEVPHSNPNVFFEHDQEVRDLLKQIKDATSKLQTVKSEREKEEMLIHQCSEELNRRSLLLPVDDKVFYALMELEDARQRKQALIQLIQSLNTCAREMRLTVKVMQKQVKAMEEEEEKLKVQCEQMKKTLDDGL